MKYPQVIVIINSVYFKIDTQDDKRGKTKYVRGTKCGLIFMDDILSYNEIVEEFPEAELYNSLKEVKL